MSASEVKSPIRFHSRYKHGLDEKRRVQIPSKWRSEEDNTQLTVVLWPQHKAGTCLRVYPPEEFELLLGSIEGLPNADPKKVLLRRHVGSNSDQLTVDKAGRIILPEHMAEAAGLKDQAMLAGGIKYFEIWDPVRYESSVVMDAPAAGNALGELG